MPKNSVAKNVLFGFLSWLLPLGLTFIATPFIVRKLGAADYGIYALISGFISYSFSFNIGRAVTKFVAEYRAKGENEKIGEILSATLILNFFIGTIGAILFVGLARWFTIDLLQVEVELQEKTIISFYLAAICVWLTMLGQVFSAVIQAVRRFDLFSHITTVVNFLLVAGNLILALNGFNVTAILVWNVVTTFISCLLFYITARKVLPEARLSFKFQGETLKLVTKYSAGVTAYQVFANLLLLFERGWITRTLGADALTFYAVPMTIAIYIHAFVTSLTLVLFPLTSELYAQKATETLRLLYLSSTKIIIALVVFMSLTLAIGSREFLFNWVGADFAEKSSQVMILQIAVFGLLACLIISWQLMEGIGFPAYNAILTFIWLVVTVSLMIFWTENHDLSGAAWARLFGVVVVPFSILFVEYKVFGKVQSAFWIKILFSLIIAGSLAGGIEYLILRNLPVNWLTLLLSFSASGIVYIFGLLVTKFFNFEEKQRLTGFIRKAIA